MNDLQTTRAEIHSVDEEMARLFEKRMRLSEKVAAFKAGNGLPVFDPVQEAKVLEANASFISDPVLKGYYKLFLQKNMDLSKAYQARLMQGMKIAYCGIPGAFAHLAAQKLFPDAEQIAFPDFDSAYRACEDGAADAAILPVENSYAGDVGAVMDLSFSGSLFINIMMEMDISQNLVGISGAREDDVRTVISHPQALAQCYAYIKGHSLQEKEVENTAIAAKYVADLGDKSTAAIASAQTASLYGLEILRAGINSSSLNTTRFAVFSRTLSRVAAGNDAHFILVFTVRNEAGALAKTLNIIGSHGFNMSCLHSRPLKGPQWNHYFFVELEGDINSEDGEDLLRQMRTVCDNLKLLGGYRIAKI